MLFKMTILSLVLIASTGHAASTLILEGLQSDPYVIVMARSENNFSFHVCDKEQSCRVLGKSSYSECEMKEYVKEPLWSLVILAGEVSFSKASSSWGGFVKALIWSPQDGERRINVTDLMFKGQASRTRVLDEAEKINKTLQKISSKCSASEQNQ